MSVSAVIKIKPYEKVIQVTRHHLITFIPQIIFFILLTLVPIALYWLLQRLFPTLFLNSIIYPLDILLASIFYLSILLFFYTSFVEFYLDLWIFTNDRLVDVEQTTLFARRIAEADLYQVQDVSSEVKGFCASLFNYGRVEIQTAGAVPKFILENVPHPHQLRQTILELASEDKKFHNHNNK